MQQISRVSLFIPALLFGFFFGAIPAHADCTSSQPQMVMMPAGFGNPIAGTQTGQLVVVTGYHQVRTTGSPGCGGSGGSGGGFVPTATLTATPSSISSGSASQLVWSSANAQLCVGTHFSTGDAPSGSVTVSPPDTTQYSVQCFGRGSAGSGTPVPSATAHATVSVIHGLQVSCSASPTSGVAGQTSIVWSASVSGGSGTYLYAWTGSEGLTGTTQSVSKVYVDLGVKSASIYTSSGPQSVTRSCSNTVAITSPGGSASGSEGSESSATPQCSDGFDNNGNGFIDYPDDPTCSSASDSTEDPIPGASLTLSADPLIVRSSGMANLVWSVANVEAGSCALSGTNGDSWNLSGDSGARVTSPLQGQTVYTLRCENLRGEQVSTSVTLKILPSFQEI